MWFTCHINNGLFPFRWLFLVYQQLPLDNSYIPRDLQGFAFNNSTAFIFSPFKLDFDPGSFSSGSMKEAGGRICPRGNKPVSHGKITSQQGGQGKSALIQQEQNKPAKVTSPKPTASDGRWAGRLHSFYRIGKMKYFHTSNDFLFIFLFLVCPHLKKPSANLEHITIVPPEIWASMKREHRKDKPQLFS